MALIVITFNSTYVDQDDLPVVTSGTSRYSGSSLCAESSWDRVALTHLRSLVQLDSMAIDSPLQGRHVPVDIPVANSQVRDEPIHSIQHKLTLLLPLTTPNFIGIAL